MLSVVLAARLGLASRPQLPQLPKLPQLPQLPAGVSAAACPNYLVCDAATSTDFPTPVVNAEPIDSPLITNPAQTAFQQASKVATVPVVDGQNVAPGYNTVPRLTLIRTTS